MTEAPEPRASAGELVQQEQRGDIAVLRLNRPEKHNAVNDAMLAELEAFFRAPPDGTRAVVLTSSGKNFSSGLDLSELAVRTPVEVARHSQWWHGVTETMQHCGLPVISVLTGAVIGGGLELAAATHIRVSGETTYYQMPEGQRGIFTGGGAAVRIGRIIGYGRLTEMMLTGRKYGAEEGLGLGLAHYLVADPMAKALEIAEIVARNSPLSNRLIITGLDRIADMPAQAGLFTESIAAALTLTTEDAAARVEEFLNKGNAGGVGARKRKGPSD